MRVLSINSDGSSAQSVELFLKSEGIKVETTDLGEEGADLAKVYAYDAILLDLNLTDMSGMDVLRQLRAAKVASPVLIVTGDTRIDTKVNALNLGADDYMTKPFHRDELAARIRAVVRRAAGQASSVIEIGLMVLDLGRKTIRISGTDIHLTGKEYGLVEAMALRKGQTLTKEALMNHLYGGMDEPELKIIDVFICKVRSKFREHRADHLIQTIWGRGYSLTDAPPPAPKPAEPKPPTIRSLVFDALAQGDKTFGQLLSCAPGVTEPSVRATLSVMMSAGKVVNVSACRPAVYRLHTPVSQAAA